LLVDPREEPGCLQGHRRRTTGRRSFFTYLVAIPL
jgi:hypothetical protein